MITALSSSKIRYSIPTAAFVISTLVCTNLAYSANTHGKLTAGTFVAKETIKDDEEGSTSNDVVLFSLRSYLNISEIGKSKLNFVSDIRDKHDFFGRVDSENLSLDDKNDFQVRQMTLKYPNKGKQLFAGLGRFSVLEAGGALADGVDLGWRFTDGFNAGVFGGLNPVDPDQKYLIHDTNRNIAGLYTIYFPPPDSYRNYYFFANSIVTERSKSESDSWQKRSYYYNNSIVQFNTDNRLTMLLYAYFEPVNEVENGRMSFYHRFTKRFSSTFSYYIFNYVEYEKQQDPREFLEPSSYEEGKVRLRLRTGKRLRFVLSGLYGRRKSDEMLKRGGSLKTVVSRFFNDKLSASATVGGRRNFNSEYKYGKLGLLLIDRYGEVRLTHESGVDKEDSGRVLHPNVSDVSFSKYFKNRIFVSLSGQKTTDERISISSGMLVAGYRFGSAKTAGYKNRATSGRLW